MSKLIGWNRINHGITRKTSNVEDIRKCQSKFVAVDTWSSSPTYGKVGYVYGRIKLCCGDDYGNLWVWDFGDS